MSLRFRRRLGLGKLLRLNVSKSGLSVSAGVPGANINFGKRRRRPRVTVGVPGTGISYSEQIGSSRRPLRDPQHTFEFEDGPTETARPPSPLRVMGAALRGFWNGAGIIGCVTLAVVVWFAFTFLDLVGLLILWGGLVLVVLRATQRIKEGKEPHVRRDIFTVVVLLTLWIIANAYG
jgi:hypothetical protein